MTKLEQWILRRILRKEVRQDYDHDKKISNLYSMIREACAEEFTEDNEVTRDDYLRQWFERTQYKPQYRPVE